MADLSKSKRGQQEKGQAGQKQGSQIQERQGGKNTNGRQAGKDMGMDEEMTSRLESDAGGREGQANFATERPKRAVSGRDDQ